MDYDMQVHRLIINLVRFFEENDVDEGHGIDHARHVLNHVDNALAVSNEPRTNKSRMAIRVAALLHDVDDSKFFHTENHANARRLLDQFFPGDEKFHNLVIKMIKLVSFSKNGNNVEGVTRKWLLFPRYADRLEAIGTVGIYRAYIYNKQIRRRLYISSTERAQSEEELFAIASPEKYEKYLKGKTKDKTFIGHFYAKIMHIAGHIINSGNPYFVSHARQRHQEIINFLLYFGRTGTIQMEMIKKGEAYMQEPSRTIHNGPKNQTRGNISDEEEV